MGPIGTMLARGLARVNAPAKVALTKGKVVRSRTELVDIEDEKEPYLKDVVSKVGVKGSPADIAYRSLYKQSFQDNKYENE